MAFEQLNIYAKRRAAMIDLSHDCVPNDAVVRDDRDLMPAHMGMARARRRKSRPRSIIHFYTMIFCFSCEN